ncbi:MAG: TonB-dependent receptor [Flavobacteriales bacterium]|nr:TonB-dependent receptor [Flavobacteriales bacterium]NNK80089.1 TonB-dependent receptor [Flavobacteriales bacterium]
MRILVCFLFSFLLQFAGSAQNYTVSGYVYDALTGESLIGASVYETGSYRGSTTNTYGFFSITLPEGEYQLAVTFLGYMDHNQTITLNRNISLKIEMRYSAITTKEVVIEAERNQNVESSQMSVAKLEVKQVKDLPAVFGEVDVLKTIQLLPGVSSIGEGNAGFYVRGGGPDQNLILLDEAVVYNASHLFGFFSVFNSDAIKNIELVKGGMPANYGGRLASVLDITMNEGNSKEFTGSGGIGLISSRLTLEGPIKKDTASFIVSGRRTYIDVLTKPFIEGSDFDGTGYFFYDLNAKVNWKVSDKDRLYLSGYFGRDNFNFTQPDADLEFSIPWGNATTSLRWNRVVNDRLFTNTTGTFTRYNFSFNGGQDDFLFKLSSGIRDYTLKSDWSYFPSPSHRIKFGASHINHRYTPSFAEVELGGTELNTGEKEQIYASESAVYVMDDFDLSDRLTVNAGLRLAYFEQHGPFTRYIREGDETVDIIEYSRGDDIADYLGLEPRISLRYALNEYSSIKGAFTRNLQFVHLASFSPLGLPTDLWIPSSEIVRPQIGYQYNAGYFRNFFNDTYEASIEVYYKDLLNQIEYKEGEQPSGGALNNVDNQLTFGDGFSYGLELFIKKRVGRTNGWLGYTWSRTMRQFDEILDGEQFPARFDRRHDISLAMTHQVNERWTLGGTFVFGTGSAITLPESWYFTPSSQRVEFQYGPRNSNRMRDFHRIDFSATYMRPMEKVKIDPVSGEQIIKKRRWETSWNFGIYNVYNRANPFFYYIETFAEPGNEQFRFDVKQVSLFSVLPSVTWNFKF